MSNFMYTANGSRISNKQRIIEGMTDTNTNAPTDFLNLAGNLRLAGSVRATNFYKEDGTELQSVTVNKLALPENVYYVDKKLGINQDKPTVDFDVKGKARVLGELGVDGSMGVSGKFGVKGPAIFKNTITVEDEFIANKHAGVRGNFGVGGDFNARGIANFKGPVTMEDDVMGNKNITVGGAFNAQGSALFKGLVTAEDELVVGKSAVFGGKLNLSNALLLGTENIEHPDVGDGAFYRADGQLQIATDDLIRLRHVGTKQTGIQFDVRGDKPGDIQNPNGQTKISRWGIMFGGDNNDREINSAQISAGALEPDSLNIVGMSKDKEKSSRRVDMFAEGGFKLNGSMYANVPTSDANGQQIVIGNINESNLRLGRHADYSWIQSHAGKPLKLNPLGNQVIMNPDTGFCVGSTCLTEAGLQKLLTPAPTTSSTSSNKADYMLYNFQDAIIYQNVYEALMFGLIGKSGSPTGWDETTFKTNQWQGRQLLRIGSKNAFPNGLLVNVPQGKSVIWLMVLSDRWESFEVYTKDGKSLGNFTSGFRLSNRFNPDGTTFSSNANFHTWMPIPVPGPGQYVICGGNKKNDGGNDCWISGFALSSNPWAHAMNSAVAYHWLVNEGTPNPTWVNQNDRGDNQARLDKGKTYTLMVPVVKSDKDKLLYWVLNDSNADGKISVNDKPVDKLSTTNNNNPFAKFFNAQPINTFVSTKVPADLVPASGFLKVTVDLTGINTDINFREIGTIDMP